VTFKLVSSPGPVLIVNMPATSIVSFQVADGTAVAPQRIVAKVGDWKKKEPQIEHELGRYTYYQKKLKAVEKTVAEAKAAGDNKRFEALKKSITHITTSKLVRRMKMINRWKASTFLTAPRAGVVRLLSKPDTSLEAGKPAFKIETPDELRGRFHAAAGTSYKAGDALSVATSGATKTGSCEVATVTGSDVQVRCPRSTFAVGDQLQIR